MACCRLYRPRRAARLAEAERGKGKGKGKAKKCVIHPGFVVKGTLVSFTADKADTTDTNEASVALKVTGANKHARRSGISKGDEVTYTAADDKDGFKVHLWATRQGRHARRQRQGQCGRQDRVYEEVRSGQEA